MANLSQQLEGQSQQVLKKTTNKGAISKLDENAAGMQELENEAEQETAVDDSDL